MNEAVSQLSNREIALLIWLAVLLITVLAYRPTRQLLVPLFKLIFFSKVSVVLLAMLGYLSFVSLLFHWLHLAHWWMLKDALFWFFGTGVILLLNANREAKANRFVRKIALDSFKFAVILDFVVNLYVFNLAIELILVPFLAALAMLAVVATTKDEYKREKKLINTAIIAIGLGFLTYALVNILAHPSGFFAMKNLEDFLTPIVLTLVFLPFLYGAVLYAAYGDLLIRVNFRIHDGELRTYAKRQIVMACQFRLSRVNRFAKDFTHNLGGVGSSGEVLNVINAFKVSTSNEDRRD